MSDYSCNEHGKNYVEGCVACDFPQEFYALQDENAELKRKLAAVVEAGNALVNRGARFVKMCELMTLWDAPVWKDVGSTATYMNRLRKAIDEAMEDD